MAITKVDFKDVKALYELCSSDVDLKEFCVQQGINYQKYQTWQRKQLWNEKTGRTEEVVPSTLNSVKITDLPVNAVTEENNSKMENHSCNNVIRYIQVKLPEGVTVTRSNVSTEEVITLLTKLTAALC